MKKKHRDLEELRKLMNRLNRIEGQVRNTDVVDELCESIKKLMK